MTLKHKWLIIGISGVTCGGKTTLSAKLTKMLPFSKVISQDDYFLNVDDSRHVWIPELNHINYDIMTSLDMDKMYSDILNVINTKENIKDESENVHNSNLNGCIDALELIKSLYTKLQQAKIKLLILEGFCILNYPAIAKLCSLKYYFTLTKEECYERRIKRVYDPPDCPGYFEKCAWPEYLNMLHEVQTNVNDVNYFDGTLPSPIENVLLDIDSVV